jgi:hypothetical protein
MPKPRKKKMGRPLEDVPLRKLLKTIRQDIESNLSAVPPAEGAMETDKPKRNK